jgi:hypothetical protein
MERRVLRDERGTREMIAEARGFRSGDQMQEFYEARGTWPSGEKAERVSLLQDAEVEHDLAMAVAYFEGLLGEQA